MYCGIPRSVVLEFGKACTTCQLRRPQHITAPLKPILALGFMCRLQVCQLLLVYCIELCQLLLVYCIELCQLLLVYCIELCQLLLVYCIELCPVTFVDRFRI